VAISEPARTETVLGGVASLRSQRQVGGCFAEPALRDEVLTTTTRLSSRGAQRRGDPFDKLRAGLGNGTSGETVVIGVASRSLR